MCEIECYIVGCCIITVEDILFAVDYDSIRLFMQQQLGNIKEESLISMFVISITYY